MNESFACGYGQTWIHEGATGTYCLDIWLNHRVKFTETSCWFWVIFQWLCNLVLLFWSIFLSLLLLLFWMSECYSLLTQETLTCIFVGQQNCHLYAHNHLFQIGLCLSTLPSSTICACTDFSSQGSESKTKDRSLFFSIIYIKTKRNLFPKLIAFIALFVSSKETNNKKIKLENYTFMFPFFKNLLYGPFNVGSYLLCRLV